MYSGTDQSDDAELGAGMRLCVLTTHAVVPLLLLWLFSAWIFDSDFIARWMSTYRPSAAESTLALNVSRQMLASEVSLRTGDDDVVGIIGSSSVVNGVDADAISQLWAQQGIHYRAINFGQTGLVAYELPLVPQLTLSPKVRVIVYLYNTFSFGERFLATVVGVRWNTQKMMSLDPFKVTVFESWQRYSTGIINENLAIVRYGNVAKSIMIRALRGDLKPLDFIYDYPLETTPAPNRPHAAEPPASESDWLRKAYLDSSGDSATLGYRGLALFLQLATDKGIRVVVAPIPEPLFGLNNRWRVGTDPGRVDSRVAEIATDKGAIWWSRERNAAFESDDTLFRDPTHFNRFGRDSYSLLLASWIESVLP